ncbi:MAG: GNAT family N-acetyltransferase [Alphaproteobacteria bacterium]|nr:GNAT family N-acetyltransferase [Alphaproteobacteria bacterium]
MLRIQAYQPCYQGGVLAVILPIQQQEFDIPITLAQQPDLQDIPGFYQQRAGNFWAALADDQVVGTIALCDIGGGAAALRKMFVSATYRGQPHQVAAHLLQHLLQWAAVQQLQDIYLGTTAQFVGAQRFYEKHSFRLIDKAELPASFPLMVVDSKFYHLACDKAETRLQA